MNKLKFKINHMLTTAAMSFLMVSISAAAPRPKGVADAFTVNKNEAKTLSILANDIGTGLKVLSVDRWTDNGGITATNANKTAIIYTPPAGYVGSDEFWYDFVDTQGQSDYAVVKITVKDSGTPPPNNKWPVAKADKATTKKNKSVTVNVLSNDTGSKLKILEFDQWTNMGGKVKLNPAKTSMIYTPPNNFTGTDSFWYGMVDKQSRDDYADVTVTVTGKGTPPTNVWPVAKTDNISIAKNESINIPVLTNDTGNGLTIKTIDTSSDNGGVIAIDSTKKFIKYTAPAGFTGIDTLWYEMVDNANRSDWAEVKITVTQKSVTRFSHIQMHYDLLQNQAMIWGEIGSKPPYGTAVRSIQLTDPVTKGSTTLFVRNNAGLVKKQLITYLGRNGRYYVGQIKNLTNSKRIELMKPLEVNIAKGKKVWNFYGNPSHPNKYGYVAIVDYAIKSLKFNSNTQGKHLLFGDSWFDNGNLGHTENRLKQRLPKATIINQGEGGNTTADLLNRFDRDVTPHKPDYIWITSGTNDYWNGLTTAKFKSNLDTLIKKSKAIGAQVIIFDSSVGESVGPTGISNQLQSEEYANAVLELNK